MFVSIFRKNNRRSKRPVNMTEYTCTEHDENWAGMQQQQQLPHPITDDYTMEKLALAGHVSHDCRTVDKLFEPCPAQDVRGTAPPTTCSLHLYESTARTLPAQQSTEMLTQNCC